MFSLFKRNDPTRCFFKKTKTYSLIGITENSPFGYILINDLLPSFRPTDNSNLYMRTLVWLLLVYEIIRIFHEYEDGIEKYIPKITDWLHDACRVMTNSDREGQIFVSEMLRFLLGNDEIEVFLKLYILLYADDKVILVKSKDELQAALNAIYLYCKSWDLIVNPSKTKITIFSNRKFQHNYVFTYNNQVLDINENFVYLGIMFSYNGRFLKTIKDWLSKLV